MKCAELLFLIILGKSYLSCNVHSNLIDSHGIQYQIPSLTFLKEIITFVIM